MKYYRMYEKVSVSNAEQAFKMPYDVYGETDLEIQKWRYFRLTNQPKTLLSVRCNRFVNGIIKRFR